MRKIGIVILFLLTSCTEYLREDAAHSARIDSCNHYLFHYRGGWGSGNVEKYYMKEYELLSEGQIKFVTPQKFIHDWDTVIISGNYEIKKKR